ncbi:MAG: 1-(5-phosphoribosyl)-5-[(5-phosphoribosylamino) methylideneamino] imidazole-4-carboxamide isomerase [Gemmatales bacterium]|nr:MAG: 1-(5-phosphoribosyl)-5-[(5-phosphoribosylamino) methylideneamino] imidazole-4-carboxamide isomerase [Gemmatales bacterium]
MQILPAIDIRGGQCVRLRQGDYDQETVFGSDPAAMARRWMQQGAEFLHLVDLDGARQGKPVNVDCVVRIVEETNIPCQLGGGLRTEEDIARVLQLGVARVVVGSRAIREPDWLERICQRFPKRIVLGVDARDGRLSVEGWREQTEESASEFVERVDGWPLAAIVYTDISRDGMLEGPNFAAYEALCQTSKIPVIASGGITTLDDIRKLSRLPLAGCIIGRALYEGRIALAEAIRLVRSSTNEGATTRAEPQVG